MQNSKKTTKIEVKKINFEKGSCEIKDYQIQETKNPKSIKSISYSLRWQLANLRSGNANTKSMSEISGTTAKPWKQKGTGRARQGSRRSVQFVGGRTCHGPVQRSFKFSIPRKIITSSIKYLLNIKIIDKQLIVFSDSENITKTSQIKSVLEQNGIKEALFLVDSKNKINKSARNIKNIKVLNYNSFNILDLIRFENLFIEEKLFNERILNSTL